MTSLPATSASNAPTPLDVAIIPREPKERGRAVLLGAGIAIGGWLLLIVVSYICIRWLLSFSSSHAVANADICALLFSSVVVLVAPVIWIVFQRMRGWKYVRARLLRRLENVPTGSVTREEASRALVQIWRRRIAGHPAFNGVSKTMPEDVGAIEEAFGLRLPRVFVEEIITAEVLRADSERWRGSPPFEQRIDTFQAGFFAFAISFAVFVAAAIAVIGMTSALGPAQRVLLLCLFPVQPIVFMAISSLYKSSIRFERGRVFVQHRRPLRKTSEVIDINPHQCIVLLRFRKPRDAGRILWEFRPPAGQTPFFTYSFDPRESPWEEPFRRFAAFRLGVS